SPTILPVRLRIAEMRWSVRSIPARLSSPKMPMCSTTWAMSTSGTSRSRSVTSLSGNRASGRRPRSRTTSITSSLFGSAWTAATISDGSAERSASRSSIDSRRAFSGPTPALLADARRHESRLGDADDGFLHEQRDAGDRIEPRFLESPVDRRFVRPDRGDHALVRSMARAAPGPGRDRAQRIVGEIGHVDARPGDDLQVVRLVLLRDADLDEGVELGAVLAAARGLLDESLAVAQAEDRGEAAARDPPVRALALPVGQPDRLESLDGLRRRRPVQTEQRDRVERNDGPDPAILHLGIRPWRRQRLIGDAVLDRLLAVAHEARLHEQLDVAVLVGAGDGEPDGAALTGFAGGALDTA